MRLWQENMKLELLLRDLSTTLLAIAIGLIVYNRLKLPVKLLLLQAAVYVVVDIVAFYIHKNLWLYNLYVPMETGLLFLSAAIELNTIKARRSLATIFAVYICVFVTELVMVKLEGDFVYISVLTQYVLVACLYTFLLFKRINPSNNSELDVSYILMCFGIVVYSAGCIPCLAAMKQLMFVDMGLSQELFVNIVVLLAALRYFLLALGFVLIGRKISL